MKSPLLPATAVALLMLSACQSKTATTTVENSVTENKTVVATKRVELPPPIKAEVSFRCHGDNSSVKVSFFDGDKLVSVQSPADAPPVSLKATEAGKPYVADGGWELTGTPKSIKLTQPGKPAQTCDA